MDDNFHRSQHCLTSLSGEWNRLDVARSNSMTAFGVLMNLTNSKGRDAAASITHANLGLRGKGTRVLAFLKESAEVEVSLGSCEHLEIAATLQTSNGKKTWVVIGQSSDLQRKTTTPVSAVMDSIRSLKSSKVKVV